ncbi:MAG: protein-glutamate O-methyltransferase CheR [Rhodospirillales bacterium]
MMYDQLSERHYRQIAAVIEQNVGIKLPPSKRTMVEGRLRKRVRALGLRGVDDYCRALFEDGQFDSEYVHLVDMVTTNKTDFFREPEHFDFLRDEAVPALLDARAGDRRLKIWSAASSTGAEAYTVAMVLDDKLRSAAVPFRYSILGTDVSTEVVAQATRAVYPDDMLAPIPAEFRRRYVLRPRNAGRQEFRIAPELRARARFHHLNLMDATYPVDRDVDVVFCRNVLIYFDRPTQHAVLTRLTGHLRPGGYLILGHSESAAGGNLDGMRQLMATVWRRQ